MEFVEINDFSLVIFSFGVFFLSSFAVKRLAHALSMIMRQNIIHTFNHYSSLMFIMAGYFGLIS